MNSPEISSGDEVQNLRSEVESLRFMLSFAVLVMFVFNMSVYFFVWQQAKITTGLANQDQAVVNEYETRAQPEAVSFWNQINDFASKHPDFAPTFAKYQKVMNVTPVAPAAKK